MSMNTISKATLVIATIASAHMVFADSTTPVSPSDPNSVPQQEERNTPIREDQNHTTDNKALSEPLDTGENAATDQDAESIVVVSFKENSATLSENSQETLSNVAQELDKKIPTELVVEVSGSVEVESDGLANRNSDPTMDGSGQEQDSSIHPEQPMATNSTPQITQNRAESVKAFLEDRGVEVVEMSVEPSTENSASIQNEMPEQDANSEKVQKIRIVITEETPQDRVSGM